MSRLEIIMLVALGFTVASLAALFIGRILLILTERRTRARVSRALPDVISRLETERDRLRVELALRDTRHAAALAEQKAEIVRQTGDDARLRSENAHLKSALDATRGEIYRLTGELAAARAELAALGRELEATPAEADHAAAALPPPHATIRQRRSRSETDSLFARIEALTELARDIERQRVAGELSGTTLKGRLSAAETAAHDLEKEVRGTSRAAAAVTSLGRRLRSSRRKPQG